MNEGSGVSLTLPEDVLTGDLLVACITARTELGDWEKVTDDPAPTVGWRRQGPVEGEGFQTWMFAREYDDDDRAGVGTYDFVSEDGLENPESTGDKRPTFAFLAAFRPILLDSVEGPPASPGDWAPASWTWPDTLGDNRVPFETHFVAEERSDNTPALIIHTLMVGVPHGHSVEAASWPRLSVPLFSASSDDGYQTVLGSTDFFFESRYEVARFDSGWIPSATWSVVKSEG